MYKIKRMTSRTKSSDASVDFENKQLFQEQAMVYFCFKC